MLDLTTKATPPHRLRFGGAFVGETIEGEHMTKRSARSPNGTQRTEWKARLNEEERAIIETARAKLGGLSNGQLLVAACRLALK